MRYVIYQDFWNYTYVWLTSYSALLKRTSFRGTVYSVVAEKPRDNLLSMSAIIIILLVSDHKGPLNKGKTHHKTR